MAEVNWRRHHQEFNSLTEEIKSGVLLQGSGIHEKLRLICQDDPAFDQMRLGVESYLIAFLEFLFYKAEGPYSPGFQIYAGVIRTVFSQSEHLVFLLDHNAADAIGNMVLNRRGKLKFLIADRLELMMLLDWWPRFGLKPVNKREVFDAVMRKSTIQQRAESGDPGLILRLYEVFPEFKCEFCPDDVNLEDVISRISDVSPLPSCKRFNRLYTHIMNQGRDIQELIREEERRILPVQAKRNTFLAYLVKKLHHDTCQICPLLHAGGRNPMISAHHITPLSEGGKDKASNILVVCNSHHQAIHQGLIQVTVSDSIEVRCQESVFLIKPNLSENR